MMFMTFVKLVSAVIRVIIISSCYLGFEVYSGLLGY